MKAQTLRSSQGFTLIEILVVVLIIGLLAGIVGPRLFDKPDIARQNKASAQITNLYTALKMYKLDNGFFPTTEQGLEALVVHPQSEPLPKKWSKKGYLDNKEVPKDPWGNAYVYLSPGAHGDVDISSYGADSTPGGEDINKDINSWEVE